MGQRDGEDYCGWGAGTERWGGLLQGGGGGREMGRPTEGGGRDMGRPTGGGGREMESPTVGCSEMGRPVIAVIVTRSQIWGVSEFHVPPPPPPPPVIQILDPPLYLGGGGRKMGRPTLGGGQRDGEVYCRGGKRMWQGGKRMWQGGGGARECGRRE